MVMSVPLLDNTQYIFDYKLWNKGTYLENMLAKILISQRNHMIDSRIVKDYGRHKPDIVAIGTI